MQQRFFYHCSGGATGCESGERRSGPQTQPDRV